MPNTERIRMIFSAILEYRQKQPDGSLKEIDPPPGYPFLMKVEADGLCDIPTLIEITLEMYLTDNGIERIRNIVVTYKAIQLPKVENVWNN